LDRARRAVEIAIEDSEGAALRYLSDATELESPPVWLSVWVERDRERRDRERERSRKKKAGTTVRTPTRAAR
jgi:hypothetical protein